MASTGSGAGWAERGWRRFVYLAAVLFGVQIIMGLTGIPRGVVRWFEAADAQLSGPPGIIVVLGGEGIPSESGLIRTYHAATAARRFPEARVICSLPADGDPDQSSVGRMRDELVLRGVPRETVMLEYRAHNTHAQAEAIRAMLDEAALASPLMIVTSPSHARRAVLCFRKAGFREVASLPAVSQDVEADMGQGLFLRYGFWNALETEVRFARELVAMIYYKLRGWI
ncbi:MAG: YdcF family protein [Lentisphaerae bacterium]|nr:YdcF family protein [Lentisphaerota bacterium]